MYLNLIKEKEYIASENLMFQLSEKIGRQKSHKHINKIIKKSYQNNSRLINLFLSDKILKKYFNNDQIKNFLNPLNYMGESVQICKETLKFSKIYNKKLLNRLKKKDLNVRR